MTHFSEVEVASGTGDIGLMGAHDMSPLQN